MGLSRGAGGLARERGRNRRQQRSGERRRTERASSRAGLPAAWRRASQLPGGQLGRLRPAGPSLVGRSGTGGCLSISSPGSAQSRRIISAANSALEITFFLFFPSYDSPSKGLTPYSPQTAHGGLFRWWSPMLRCRTESCVGAGVGCGAGRVASPVPDIGQAQREGQAAG